MEEIITTVTLTLWLLIHGAGYAWQHMTQSTWLSQRPYLLRRNTSKH